MVIVTALPILLFTFFYVDPKTIHHKPASATAAVSDRPAIPRVRNTTNQFVPQQPTSKQRSLLATNKTGVLDILATHTDIKSSTWNRYLFSYVNQYFYLAVIYAMFGGKSRLCKHLQYNMLIKINSVIF
jgi:hypothetical protein